MYQQALHELDLPRHYQTIVACGVIGVGVSRQQDFMALQRFYDHLLPGGLLILDGLPAYAEARLWPLWHKDARRHLPEPWSAEIGKVPANGREYELYYRLVALDPLAQRTVDELRTLLFKDGQLVADDTYTLQSTYYFCHEMQLLLEKAGFTVEAVKGDFTDADVTAEHDAIVYFARK